MDEMIEKVKNGYNLHVYKDKLELSTAVFKFIQSHIIHTLKKKDRFKFCVSGGSTPNLFIISYLIVIFDGIWLMSF